jgi:acyl carrier protein
MGGKMDRLYEHLAELLETDTVRPDDTLADFEEWDSLTALTIVDMISNEYGIELVASDLIEIATAGDIEKLIRDRKSSNG